MRAPVLIVGQGLAGTALGLELEAAGVPFVIVSNGHATAASRVAAGLINPVTGQRFVKTWRVDALLPLARAAYARWEQVLGARLWHDVEIERRFADATEAARATRKHASGELAPYVADAMKRGAVQGGEEALHVRGGAWIDLPQLLTRAAERWERAGVLRSGDVAKQDLLFSADAVEWGGERFAAVVLATGAGALAREFFSGAAWTPIKGQILALRGAAIRGGRVVHRGVWLLGERDGSGRAGAMFERGRDDLEVTADARETLWRAASDLAGGELEVVGQAAGVRLAADDRLPVAGWHPRIARLGLLGALGSKGALWAPWLAEVWRAEVQGERALPDEISPARLMT